MSYTAKPPFNVPPGAQNQTQKTAPGARDSAAQNPSGAVQNAPSIANNSSAANNLLANAGSMNLPVMNRQFFQSHQQQQLLQQQLFLQQLQQQQQQQQQGQQVNAASIQRMVTDYQKSLTPAVQQPNGNLNAASALSATQQIQQFVQLTSTQPTANLLQLLQQAQAQVAQQQQQQQKPFQQQVPLPQNTTITPVSSRQQNYSPATGASNQQKSVVNYSPAKPSQSKQSQGAQARRNTTLPKVMPIPPPAMPSHANLKASAASNYTAAKLPLNIAPNPYAGIANVKTASVPPPLPNISISKVQVATGDSGGASRAGSNVAVPVNASVKSDASKPILSAGPPITVSPLKVTTPPKSEKLSPASKVTAPVSPRTKQTPRKNSNPIKTTPPPTIGSAVSSTTISPVAVTTAVATTTGPASKVVATVATVTPKLVAIAQSKNPVSKPDVVTAVVKPAVVSTTAPPLQQQQQSDEKSPKPASTAPTKSTAVAQVTEKSATKSSTAANATPAKTNDVVDAKSPKKTPAAKSTPLPPKPSASATPKATVSMAPKTAESATPKPEKKSSAAASTPKPATPSSVDQKVKRNRLRTIPYQSPIPEIELISKLTAIEANNSSKNTEDKLIIFYKNEFLAVRNDEGSFFLCQSIQNVYKSSPRIRIRWLSEDKQNQSIYALDFYDHTDLECVLTTVSLEKQSKGKFELTKAERERVQNILQKALDVEKGVAPRPDVTEENPDGLDLSLYKNESQIEKKTPNKRKASEPKSTKKISSAAAATTTSGKQKASQEVDESDDDDNYEPSNKRKKAPIKRSAKKRAPPPKSPAKKQEPAPKVTPSQKSGTKDDQEIASTPKTTKAPAKRKLVEKVDSAATPDAEPNEVNKDKPKSDKDEAKLSSSDHPSPQKLAKVVKSNEKPAVSTSPTSGGRTTRRSRV